MKKFIVLILAVFYLGVSSGAGLHFHHCMGQLVEWGLSSTKAEASSGCKKCGMKAGAENDCCKHQTKEVKVDKVQKVSESYFQFAIQSTEVKSAFPDGNILSYSSVTEAYPVSKSPPGKDDSAKYLQVCSFRI